MTFNAPSRLRASLYAGTITDSVLRHTLAARDPAWLPSGGPTSNAEVTVARIHDCREQSKRCKHPSTYRSRVRGSAGKYYPNTRGGGSDSGAPTRGDGVFPGRNGARWPGVVSPVAGVHWPATRRGGHLVLPGKRRRIAPTKARTDCASSVPFSRQDRVVSRRFPADSGSVLGGVAAPQPLARIPFDRRHSSAASLLPILSAHGQRSGRRDRRVDLRSDAATCIRNP